MFDLVTIPSRQRLLESKLAAPDFMRPNDLPWAVVAEGVLSDEQCEDIIEAGMAEEPYQFRHCGAITRELARPLDLRLAPLVMTANTINDLYWQYELDPNPAAWLQTYSTGGDYPLHVDSAPGQMRKLTAVLMLTDRRVYTGGTLWVRLEPREHIISKKRGTVVVFPSWLPHRVDPVTEGTRQTINLGFWGPNFR